MQRQQLFIVGDKEFCFMVTPSFNNPIVINGYIDHPSCSTSQQQENKETPKTKIELPSKIIFAIKIIGF
jgi:hypothetical protein